ncbi:C13 peptidase, partial [Helicosporidium sp. ATCC 50920]
MNLQRFVLVAVATTLVATVTARSAFDALIGSEHRSNANGDTWAVLVAGSMGWGNYRHQADVAHAYQVLRKGGIKEDRIITLMYNDVANNAANPHPGKLFNKPGGGDVYDGVVVDYEGEHVTAATFMAVLAGDKSKVSNTTGSSGRVLDSKAEDHVFVYFSDHGAPGIISMPVGPFVYADQLLSTLRARHAANGFGSMVLYIEACESGSMFEGLLEEDLNIWAVTAANGKESSWGTYCPGQDPSPPPEFTTCLADLFSAAWMEDAEDSDACQETLQKQFDNVRLRTSQNNTYAQGSHVQHFGTLEMGENHTSAFLGSGTCKYQPGVVDNARSNAPAANSRRR